MSRVPTWCRRRRRNERGEGEPWSRLYTSLRRDLPQSSEIRGGGPSSSSSTPPPSMPRDNVVYCRNGSIKHTATPLSTQSRFIARRMARRGSAMYGHFESYFIYRCAVLPAFIASLIAATSGTFSLPSCRGFAYDAISPMPPTIVRFSPSSAIYRCLATYLPWESKLIATRQLDLLAFPDMLRRNLRLILDPNFRSRYIFNTQTVLLSVLLELQALRRTRLVN